MLDPQQIPPTTAAIDWATVNRGFSDWLDSETTRTSEQKRKSVDALLLQDIAPEIAEEALSAGLTHPDVSRWLKGSATRDIREMPALGLFREMLQQRHLNVGTTWRSNDLTDMLYLSCATGYADIVVTERHMSAIASQSLRRLGRQVSVVPSLRDVTPMIEAHMSRQRDLSRPQ